MMMMMMMVVVVVVMIMMMMMRMMLRNQESGLLAPSAGHSNHLEEPKVNNLVNNLLLSPWRVMTAFVQGECHLSPEYPCGDVDTTTGCS